MDLYAENSKEWLGREDSNPRMLGPEPSALPLGDAPKIHAVTYSIYIT